MSVVRERLAALCDQIARHSEMRQAIGDADAGPQLAELLDAVTAEQTPDQGRLLVLLDEIEEACSRDGLAGITTSSKQYTPARRLLGVQPGRAAHLDLPAAPLQPDRLRR